MNAEQDELWSSLWFMTRVSVGWLIHVSLILCALFNVEVMFEATKGFYQNHADAPMFSATVVGVFMAISYFTASMAGVYWVKSMYIRHFIPEVMDEAAKRLMKG